jgi:ATP-dependent Clp protease adapter protein ClpS
LTVPRRGHIVETVDRQQPWWQRALGRIGVQVSRLDQLPPEIDDEAAAQGRYIFVLNDDVSPMDKVTLWLAQSFDLPKHEAVVTMMVIHHHGLGVVGPFPADEAERRMTVARERAVELGLTALTYSRERPVTLPDGRAVAWGEHEEGGEEAGS